MKRILVAVVVVTCALVQSVTAKPSSGGAFAVSEQKSTVRVHVGKSGALSFAGHRHLIVAPVRGSITADPGELRASSVELSFPTAGFRVLPEGEPAGDPAKVEEVMRGPRVLDAIRFPELRFRSRSVAGRAAAQDGSYDVEVKGDLSLHGVTREVVVPMVVRLDGDTLSARGRSKIRQDQFGLTPVTAGGGTVRVANEIEIDFEIVATRRR